MSDKTYNGWTNYETWNIKLWLDNDQASYNYWRDRARKLNEETTEDNIFTKDEKVVLDLAEELQYYHQQEAYAFLKAAKRQSSWASDLLSAALSEVNWREIAQSLLEE